MDQSLPNRQQGRAPQHAATPMGAFRQGNIPTLERGVISGDKVQFGRPQRHMRLSHSEGHSSGEEWLSSSMEGGSYGRSPVLRGMQAEGNWHQRGAYEQAEGNYQRRVAPNGNGLLSSSPRSPNTRGYMTYRNRGQRQEGHPITVKASGTPHRQYSRGRNRTSSETEQGSKGSRGPSQRKRGLSETESRPRWDKYGNLTQGMGET
ncbi:uncharacterized protein LOC117827420 [Notolabrus celidotus]|uniref:uncharacterized protein LOC117827420 n=1 Tax=Notolabrus celidotus TaxID=1203425 RepID=UPI001490506F|nr:uncharacterized protein LOC117827420 [Notolabrus celidotus]XP_034559915.1 uncharacterized protein LOC117827420 [Notolabrus celidotus]